MIDLDSSVPDLLVEYPRLFHLWQELGIEYTCGGKSLLTACRDRGLDPKRVVSMSEQLLREVVE
jgi:iron-sulfur cluster repair protein YtfE (RIC family)